MSSSFLSLLFADDTTLLLSHNNLRTLIQLVNIEFRKVCEFFRINKLVLHPDKTKFILFSQSNVANESVELFCNNNNLTQDNPDLIHPITRVFSSDDVPAIKFLGIFFIRILTSSIIFPFLNPNCPKFYMPLELSGTCLEPTAYCFCTIQFFIVT